jgi:DNA-binding transcriptional LysR family regulator
MDIKQIKYFLQICKDKSFSKASKNLYISQQGLSKTMRNLEEELKVPLFCRSVNGIQLTEYGQYLQNKSIDIIAEFDMVLDNLNNMASHYQGNIAAGFSFGVLDALSTDLISGFLEAYPNIKLSKTEYPDLPLQNAVMNEEIDVALVVGPVDENKFHSTSVKKKDVILLVNERNPLSMKSTVQFNDLKNEKIIIINENFQFYYNFINKCRESGFAPKALSTVAEIHSSYNQVRMNKGVSFGLDFASNNFDCHNIKLIPFAGHSLIWEIILITKRGHYVSHEVRVFTNYVLNYLQ